ncbi:MarR family winged helix-turn-helix transcriptional regulator [Kocuria sp.]|uniref:MarR family winged helix-turn-helix transcriptional regulator n=1 Tax=Kocuria sp. TaxID=1871328 RepID=UPI0026DAEF1F|nr:MarR family transcriptional regulator [Kocuria sp.]MDO4920013.1 MarR family transcriptional regulator [Kocuria sp.]
MNAHGTSQEDPLTGPRVLAWRSLMRAQVRVLSQIRGELRPLGVSVSDFDVLVNIEPGEQLRHSTLAERVVLSRTGLTRLVDRMCRRGLVRRDGVATDGRGVLISLTPEGEELRREAVRLNARAVHRAMAELTASDVTALRALTSALGREPKGT